MISLVIANQITLMFSQKNASLKYNYGCYFQHISIYTFDIELENNDGHIPRETGAN